MLYAYRGSQQGGGGPMGMGGPLDLSRSGAKVQMQPDTGVTFNDVVGVDNGEYCGFWCRICVSGRE